VVNGPAGDFLAPPLAVGAGLETDHATPATRAMPVGLRVAALPRVIAGPQPQDGLPDGVTSEQELIPVTWGDPDLDV
jgi:hypothetical protein